MPITKHVDLTGLGHFRDKILVSEIFNEDLYSLASGSPNPYLIYYHLEAGEYVKVLDPKDLPADLTGKDYYTAKAGAAVDEQHAPSIKALNEYVPDAVAEHIEEYVAPIVESKLAKTIKGGAEATTISASLDPSNPSAVEVPTSKAVVDAINPILDDLEEEIASKATRASTLAGYGITDAKIENGVITLGSNTVTPVSSEALQDYVPKTRKVNNKALSADITITKTDVELGSVINDGQSAEYKTKDSSATKYFTQNGANNLYNELDAFKVRLVAVEDPNGDYYNSQANWNESDENSWSYIQNKPTVLPNPTALTLTVNGAATTYTGAAAKSVTINKSTIGLGNVDNTSDVDKPISTATQAALDEKAAASHTHTTTDITDFPTLGTASAKDVPATGNATTTQVVMGSDTRLTDARTPKSHTHSASDVTGLATVATSGSYTDLSNKPTIPTTGSIASGNTGYVTGDAAYTALAGKADTSHTQAASTITGLADVATSGSYEDLTNKPTIPTITDTYSSTSSNGMSGKAVASAISNKMDKVTLADVATSGSYSDLTNKPTIPNAGTSASAVGTTASGGSATTYSKSDHVHNITLATGDANGQVKIAGTNVDVKGLGSAAYTASTAYATATQGTKADNALPKSDVVDGLTTASATKALSANQGVELDKRIKNLEALGRYLSEWDCTTGTAMTEPLYYPYPYKAGDYFLVLAVGSTNYKPTGSEYTQGYKSTTVETKTVQQGDRYIFDGSVWILQSNAQQTVSFANIAGNATDNTSLATALNGKANSSHTQAASTITGLAAVATTGSYSDLSNKPTIPSKTSQLTNDSGFLTSHQDISGKENTSNKVTSWSSTTTDTHYPSEKLVKTALDGKANSSHTHTKSQITDFPTLATVATSGSYNDLSNKPTIPTITDTYSATSTAGMSGKAVASAISNKMDKVTLATVATSGSYNDLSDKPTIPSAVTESTVSGWGFTKNAGTITGIKMNGASVGTSGVVDLGTVLTAHQSLSGYVPTSRTVNGKALSANISLTASDVGAAASSHNQASSTITAMTSYAKATSAAAISTSDSLNTAIGKLEYKIDQASAGDIRQIANTFTQANTFSANSTVTASSTTGTITVTNGGIVANGGIKGTGVYGAVWNDLVDRIPVDDNCELEYGRCYCFDGEKYYKSDRYLADGIIGIHSDTAGFEMGHKDNVKELACSVAGFVLAYVDKVYPVGTPLTVGENGCLTEIKKQDKIEYPEKIVATFWKDETAEEWGSDQKKVQVNGRKWVKVK